MRPEFKIAYEKADEILKKINYSESEMIRTASIIGAVEEILHIDVKFSDYNFSKLTPAQNKLDVSNFGAAMKVFESDNKKYATILINEKENTKMKRFSLVHELGHLMTQSFEEIAGYKISTHIDMDITSIPENILDNSINDFLIKEQIANIFALLVLIPYDMLIYAFKHYETIDEIANFFGVEKDALVSRLLLKDAQDIISV